MAQLEWCPTCGAPAEQTDVSDTGWQFAAYEHSRQERDAHLDRIAALERENAALRSELQPRLMEVDR